ncbi:odorant receptor 131-2-like [Halichoeres trimaculatus]|uniref:odorant receptor 131-2-like n=1 Tax=Halichoeres trimaculatus TaxID=147232 RepID=UPI003D9F2CB4
MNVSGRLDSFTVAFIKNFLVVTLAIAINSINGLFVYIYFSSQVFQRDPRYIFYIHLVINDMIMLTLSVLLHILAYITPLGFIPCCILVTISATTTKNTPLNLAGMAVERYIAVCHPLHHVQLCTVWRAYVFIGLIWGISLIPNFADIIIVYYTKPLSFFFQPILCYQASIFGSSYHRVKVVILQVLQFSFVALTLIVTYLKVLCVARAVSASNRDSARNAHNTILLHGGQLLICLLSYVSPFMTIYLVAMWPTERTNIQFNAFVFTNMFPRLLSPLIYGVRDKKFSSCIRLQFCRKYSNALAKKVNNMATLQRKSNNVLP